jgi:hypothetical protein
MTWGQHSSPPINESHSVLSEFQNLSLTQNTKNQNSFSVDFRVIPWRNRILVNKSG